MNPIIIVTNEMGGNRFFVYIYFFV